MSTTVTTSAAAPPPAVLRDWRAEHDTLLAELLADGVDRAAAPFIAYVQIAQRAADASDGDLYTGCCALTAARIMWPTGASRLSSRMWSRLRPDDGFAPGDGDRRDERIRRAAREEARQAPPPPPKWRPRNVADFVVSASRAHVEHLAKLWLEHHGVDAVRAEDIAAPIRAFVGGDDAASATAHEIAGAIAWHIAGWRDGEGRSLTVIEETNERRPLVLGFQFAPVPQRATPTDPKLIRWHERMAQREAELLEDATFAAGQLRDDRVVAAQAKAYAETVVDFAVEIGLPEREAARRFSQGGLHR